MERTYYHSVTGEPFDPEDFQQDSEEELDDSWLTKSEEKQIDELEQFGEREKAFFKLWNKHVHKHYKIKADYFMKQACISFVENNTTAVKRMRELMNLHLLTMWSCNILTADDLLYLQLKINQLLT